LWSARSDSDSRWLAQFLIVLICCLPGAIVYFFYKPSVAVAHVKLREMEKEIAVLEHGISETE
jgi:hypothetical protein